MGRTADRAHAFDEKQRISMAERDLDEHETKFGALHEELGKIKGILMGILVSTATAALLLAMNLVVSRG